MTEQQIIHELDSIISYCDVTKEKATGLRRKLENLYSPVSRKRAKISDAELAKVISRRRNFINKKAMR